MKVGVITYFDIKNYGSVLQAFALKTILAQYGVNVVFIKVKEKKIFFAIFYTNYT